MNLTDSYNRIKLLFFDPRTFFEKVRETFVSKIWFQDHHSKRFIQHNKKVWSGWGNNDPEAEVLFDYYPIAETEIARGYLLNILAKKLNAKIVSYSYEKSDNAVWNKIYNSFNVAKHFNISLTSDQKARSTKLSNEIIIDTKTKQELFDLKIFGVWIGVDIYEEFLMRYQEPSVIIDDKRLQNTIRLGIDALVFWKEYFEKNNVKAFISSHIGVRRKNIPLKVAGQLFNIPFYSTHAWGITHYPKPHLYFKEVEKKYMSYHQKFKSLPEDTQNDGKNWAKGRLDERLSGKIGVDMPYSTKTAFTSNVSSQPVVTKNNKIKILVTTHEFYDSPNCYGNLLFTDFYEWLMFLGGVSRKANYDWYFKTHPDVSFMTERVIKKIVAENPNFNLVPSETSFHQLATEGIEYVLTCYGSVGHECPLLGMKVINAGNNPHMGYDFNWNPKTVDEYEDLLLNLGELKKEINFDDIYEFYYMNYKRTGIIDDWIYPSYDRMISDLTIRERYGSAIFGYFLDSLTKDKHKKIISRMTDFIETGETGSPEY
jgi:hypothetical protein